MAKSQYTSWECNDFSDFDKVATYDVSDCYNSTIVEDLTTGKSYLNIVPGDRTFGCASYSSTTGLFWFNGNGDGQLNIDSNRVIVIEAMSNEDVSISLGLNAISELGDEQGDSEGQILDLPMGIKKTLVFRPARSMMYSGIYSGGMDMQIDAHHHFWDLDINYYPFLNLY